MLFNSFRVRFIGFISNFSDLIYHHDIHPNSAYNRTTMNSNQIPTTSNLSGLSPAQLNQQLRAENDSLRLENRRLLEENQTQGAEVVRLHNISSMYQPEQQLPPYPVTEIQLVPQVNVENLTIPEQNKLLGVQNALLTETNRDLCSIIQGQLAHISIIRRKMQGFDQILEQMNADQQRRLEVRNREATAGNNVGGRTDLPVESEGSGAAGGLDTVLGGCGDGGSDVADDRDSL